MFHTFSTAKAASTSITSSSNRRKNNSVRACDECRRRKIRCDGQRPCESCQWYQRTESCRYQDLHSQDRQTADAFERIVKKLLPNKSTAELASLADLSPLELLHLAKQDLVSQGPPSRAISPPLETQVSPSSETSGDLATLQMMPHEELEGEHDTESQDTISNFSDDVNALALSSKPPSSYLGASSVAAALKVIAWLQPEFPQRVSFIACNDLTQYSTTISSIMLELRGEKENILPKASHPVYCDEKYLIDGYFLYFHPTAPIIDEVTFRNTYLRQQRNDPRWLSLLNIVLALGSISVTPANNKDHYFYYQRSKSYIEFSAFGRPHIETIQTFGLMGGHYLHYISQPNLAYSLMGAALRMATSLGLHKEFLLNENKSTRNHDAAIDMRRRVWWSLICLDTWGTETLGRPSLGRWSAGITAKLPHCAAGNDQLIATLPLIESVRYCRITTQIHEAMAVVPLLAYKDLISLDQQLVEWYENLPPLLKTFDPCPEPLAIYRDTIRWRYIIQRMHLYRPALLSYAMRRIPFAALRAEERSTIETCISLSADAIHDIGASAANCSNQILGWRGVWFIFQAVVVPLVTLYIEDETNVALTGNCHSSIKMAIATLVRMQSWSPTGSRTLKCVCTIYEAALRFPTSVPSSAAAPKTGVNVDGILSPASIQNLDVFSGFTPTQPLFDGNQSIFRPGFVNADNNFGDESMWDFITWSDGRLAESLMQLDSQILTEGYLLNDGTSPPLDRDQGHGYNLPGSFT
ncbi:fungal-specific transcription factor domain-containing protein [Talaromyces proteolyticus]|uniref:Fungal-specific transcription factor domain-containing protein n=1 Tax=Talaromyces proteolyticus TaxID=1131652 RepID=A0AAD4L1K4_9EURO|nr:fungal-specific transcription factor domain-containing protein [Talaromyces proteolyticus]KAH8701549.1 fungal-specific transcription factor domain-containing protein [Talaromyces proteolyticus]